MPAVLTGPVGTPKPLACLCKHSEPAVSRCAHTPFTLERACQWATGLHVCANGKEGPSWKELVSALISIAMCNPPAPCFATCPVRCLTLQEQHLSLPAYTFNQLLPRLQLLHPADHVQLRHEPQNFAGFLLELYSTVSSCMTWPAYSEDLPQYCRGPGA